MQTISQIKWGKYLKKGSRIKKSGIEKHEFCLHQNIIIFESAEVNECRMSVKRENVNRFNILDGRHLMNVYNW